MVDDILSGMKHYVFADAENPASNVTNLADFLKSGNYLSSDTQILCIIGADKSQNNYYENLKTKIGNQKALNLTPVRIQETFENAADMVLIAYLGMAIEKTPNAEFIIVSNDTDFSPVINRFKNVGVIIKEHKYEKAKSSAADRKRKSAAKPKVKNENNNQEIQSATLSEKQIKEIAEKIYNQKSGRPKKFKTLRKRVNQYKTKYKFTENDLDCIFSKVKDYLEKNKKISLNGDRIEWNNS